jgi:hypothetical protein
MARWPQNYQIFIRIHCLKNREQGKNMNLIRFRALYLLKILVVTDPKIC